MSQNNISAVFLWLILSFSLWSLSMFLPILVFFSAESSSLLSATWIFNFHHSNLKWPPIIFLFLCQICLEFTGFESSSTIEGFAGSNSYNKKREEIMEAECWSFLSNCKYRFFPLLLSLSLSHSFNFLRSHVRVSKTTSPTSSIQPYPNVVHCAKRLVV